jgi:hypothetical protein
MPASRHEVYFTLFIEVGESGRPGSNFFQVTVATPEGLRRHGDEQGEVPERNLLVCLDYDWAQIEARIARIVAACARETWRESVACLQRYFEWEFQDWKPNPADREHLPAAIGGVMLRARGKRRRVAPALRRSRAAAGRSQRKRRR